MTGDAAPAPIRAAGWGCSRRSGSALASAVAGLVPGMSSTRRITQHAAVGRGGVPRFVVAELGIALGVLLHQQDFDALEITDAGQLGLRRLAQRAAHQGAVRHGGRLSALQSGPGPSDNSSCSGTQGPRAWGTQSPVGWPEAPQSSVPSLWMIKLGRTGESAMARFSAQLRFPSTALDGRAAGEQLGERLSASIQAAQLAGPTAAPPASRPRPAIAATPVIRSWC